MLVASCGGAEALHRGSDAGTSGIDRGLPVATGEAGSTGAGGNETSGIGGFGGFGGSGQTGGVAGSGSGGTGGADAGVTDAPADKSGAAGAGGAAGGAGAGGRGGAGGMAGAGGAGGAGGMPCSPGRALQFDGVGDIATVARQIQDDFTIEVWIKTSATSLTGTHFWDGNPLVYADKMGPANDFGVTMLNGKLAFGVGDVAIAQSTTSINTGQWVHLAVTRQRTSGAITVLVNGVAEGTATALTTSLVDQTVISIGGNTLDHRYFTGVMDEIRFWTVARTAAEIKATMNHQLAGTEAGLVGYWRFNEASGDATDSSPSHTTMTVGDGTAADLPVRVTSDAPVCQ